MNTWLRPQDVKPGDRIGRINNLNIWTVHEVDGGGNVKIQDVFGSIARIDKLTFIKAGFTRK
jgi:hypothetical protein